MQLKIEILINFFRSSSRNNVFLNCNVKSIPQCFVLFFFLKIKLKFGIAAIETQVHQARPFVTQHFCKSCNNFLRNLSR